MTKFDSKIQFLLENYIQSGTYSYTVGAKNVNVANSVDSQGDDGKKLNFKTVEDNLKVYSNGNSKNISRYPKSLLIKRFRSELLEKGIKTIKKVVELCNKTASKNNLPEIKIKNDETEQQLVDKIINRIGDFNCCWIDLMKTVGIEAESNSIEEKE